MTLGREKGEVRCLTIDKRVAIPECIGKWYSKRLVLTLPEGRHTYALFRIAVSSGPGHQIILGHAQPWVSWSGEGGFQSNYAVENWSYRPLHAMPLVNN